MWTFGMLQTDVLMEERHAHRRAGGGMAIEIGSSVVFGVVVQNDHSVEVLAPFGNGRVTHAEQNRLLPQHLRRYGKRSQRQGLAGYICDESVAKGTVIAVEQCVRLLDRNCRNRQHTNEGNSSAN